MVLERIIKIAYVKQRETLIVILLVFLFSSISHKSYAHSHKRWILLCNCACPLCSNTTNNRRFTKHDTWDFLIKKEKRGLELRFW